jgi:hypothetical protein
MRIEKIILQKSARSLLEKSADCLDLAQGQQNLADKTHELSAEQRKNADQQHVGRLVGGSAAQNVLDVVEIDKTLESPYCALPRADRGTRRDCRH